VDAFVSLKAQSAKEVAEVLNRKGAKDKIVVAMDTDEETLEWIRKGVIVATIAQALYDGFLRTEAAGRLAPSADEHQGSPAAQDPFAVLPRVCRYRRHTRGQVEPG
jgi:ribose transport system substrate-binding protein